MTGLSKAESEAVEKSFKEMGEDLENKFKELDNDSIMILKSRALAIIERNGDTEGYELWLFARMCEKFLS